MSTISTSLGSRAVLPCAWTKADAARRLRPAAVRRPDRRVPDPLRPGRRGEGAAAGAPAVRRARPAHRRADADAGSGSRPGRLARRRAGPLDRRDRPGALGAASRGARLAEVEGLTLLLEGITLTVSTKVLLTG